MVPFIRLYPSGDPPETPPLCACFPRKSEAILEQERSFSTFLAREGEAALEQEWVVLLVCLETRGEGEGEGISGWRLL